MKKQSILSQVQIDKFLNLVLLSSDFKLDYEPKRNRINIYYKTDLHKITVKLPWIIPLFKNIQNLLQYIKSNNIQKIKYQIILIQAGYAAIGRFKNSQIIAHKLIRKYMVRKKQGKAQFTYLHSKGKSRAGSRIRLAQTVQFFEEINQQVNMWHQEDRPERLMIHCSPRLWGLMFQSKIKPEFNKKDQRIIKIPVDVKIPDYKELIRINNMAQKWNIEADNYDIDLLEELKL